MKKSFQTCGNWFKSIPWYGIVIGLLLTLGFQTLMYHIGYSWIPHDSGMWYGVDPQIPSIDGRIPLVPQFFALLYQLWFGLFPVGAILASARINAGKNKEDWINLMISWVMATFIGGIVLIFFPCYVDRHNVAGVPGGDIFEYVRDKTSFWWILQKMTLDENIPREYGCLPSFHCLQIIFCYLGIMGKKDRNIGHRIGWLVIAILVCLSTLFTKQHYIIDVISAISLALICFFGVKLFNPGNAILRKCPNFLIIKKINWSHEKIIVNKTKIESKKTDKKNNKSI